MAMTRDRWLAERPRLPWPLVSVSPSSIGVEEIYDRRYWRVSESDQPIHGGFVLPPFQRPAVWNDERRARYVESLYLRLHGMPIVWNDSGEEDGPNGGPHPTDAWLIDGQQRIGAILAYVNEGLEVFSQGNLAEYRHRWTDLNGSEKGVFARLQIPTVRLTTGDADQLHDIYLRLAFGGVPHDPGSADAGAPAGP